MRMPPLTIQPEEWQYYRQRDFTGGENKLILPEFMGQNQLITGQNCVMSAEGTPETRKGKTLVNPNALAGAITSVHRYSKENGDKFLLVQQGTKLYGVVWDGAAQIAFGAEIKTLSSAAKLDAKVWKDACLMTNGADQPFAVTHNGAAFVLANIAAAPLSKIIKIYAGRVWFVDITRPNVLCPSGLESYTAFDALDEIKVRDGDGDTITNISPQPGGLVIAKNKSVWTLYGTNRNNFRLDGPIFTEDGCIAIDSMLDIGLFLGASGLYHFTLAEVTPVFNSHKPVLSALSLAQKQGVVAVVDPKERRVLFDLGNGSTICIQEQDRPDTGEKYFSMFTWKGLNASCFAAVNDKNDPGSLLIGDKDAGRIYALTNVLNDDGTKIETIIEFAYADYGSTSKKVWRRFTPEVEVLEESDYSFSLTYDVDYGALNGLKAYGPDADPNALLWDQGNWDAGYWGGAARVEKELHFEARGNRISFGVKSNDRIKVLGYMAKYREVAPK